MSLLDSANWTHSVSAYRVSLVRGQYGGQDYTVAAKPYSANIACVIQPLDPREVIQFRAQGQEVTHDVYFESDPGLLLNDALKVITGPQAGRYLMIRAFGEATIGFALLFRAMCSLDYHEESP